MKGKRVGRGVVGRAVKWAGGTWTVSKVYGQYDDFLELRATCTNGREILMGNVIRTDVKFVRHNYEAKP